ncbi:MAG TPA: SsrA-binding protein SmpB [Phycisphaerae bacterium]|nr:SsrA-binding protein SmpB [Phycisphaerales bacterium]HRX85489.1 SsrA-binding protein SmpB [Phycisphaerae bacterium]
MAKKQPNQPSGIRNKKASHKFEILEKIECGVALRGTEVKSLRAGSASLDESYARIDGEEIWLVGFNIPPYTHGNVQNHEPTRPRKLLLHKREIRKLLPKVLQRGQTLVPLRVYFNDRGLCKVTLALARGKTHGDRRQDLKKKDQQREMDRAMRR